MDHVYLLHHVREDDEHGDDAKLIGVYRSEANARLAIERLSAQSGFRDYPAGFEIGRMQLDKDHWEEGFIRWVNIMIPMTIDGVEQWRAVGSEWRADDSYEIIGPMPADEIWCYPPDTIVRCETRKDEDGDGLYAVSRVDASPVNP